MNKYFANFRVVGEIADMLLMREPKLRLQVDVSQDPPGHQETAFRKYPSRTTFTILDKTLIDDFLAQASIGCVVRLKGTITQSNYIPHRTSYIDTTLTVEGFTFLKKHHQGNDDGVTMRQGGPSYLVH